MHQFAAKVEGKMYGRGLFISVDGFLTDNVTFANEHMKVSINGEPISILRVTGGGGNGHTDYLFVLDEEIRTVEDIESIQVICKQERVVGT